MASLLYGSGFAAHGDAGCASGTSIRNKTRSNDSGFEDKPPCERKIAGEGDATLAPRILGDLEVLPGRRYPSPSPGVTAFHRRTASGGRSSAAADIASAGAAGAWDRKDPLAPAIVLPYAASGSAAILARRAPALAVTGAGAADLGVLRGIGTEVALDGLAGPYHILVAELGAVVAVVDLLGQGPVGRLDVHDAGVELDAGRLDLLKRHPRVPC